MNWILGYSGLRHDSHEARTLRGFARSASVESTSDSLYIAAAGRPGIILHRRIDQSDSRMDGWIVLGQGMEVRGGNLCRLEESDWHTRLSNETPDLTNLDGHFCAIRWTSDRLDFFNDALGLRTLFVARRSSGIAFSTSLEWLARSLEDCVPDYEAIGAQWFGRAELGSRTALSGVTRLPQGGMATLDADGFRLTGRPFEVQTGPRLTAHEALLAVACPEFGRLGRPTLACSGGLDSRVQLAALISSRDSFGLHSYGPDDHPDVRTGLELARLTRVTLERVEASSSTAGLSEAQRYASAVHAYAPASTVGDWRHYGQLDDQNAIVIDASLGEAGRCFFYRRLRSGSGARSLIERAAEQVAEIQRQPRPTVFTQSLASVMLSGHLAAVSDVLSSLPANEEADNLADLLMLRLEGPRYAGYAATHIDDLATGYFPFAQPTLLRALLGLKPDVRRGGRYYRRFVLETAPRLASVPLVRNGPYVATCPFQLKGRVASAWALSLRLAGRAWKDDRPERYLRSMESQIRDLIRSTATSQFEGYDRDALAYLVDGFFDGRHDDAASVDRWLSFELWRLGLIGVEL